MKCRLVAKKDQHQKTDNPTGWTVEADSLDELSDALSIRLDLKDREHAHYREDARRQNEPAKVVREDGKEFPVRQLIAYSKNGWAYNPDTRVFMDPEPFAFQGADPRLLPKWDS